jgi:DNA-binding protein Fis
MNLLDAVNDVESLHIDPAEVTTKDGAVSLSATPDAIHRSEADVEAVASQAMSSLMLALARYIDSLGLDQGIDLMAEAQRFERGVIERALELTKGSQKRAAKLLGLNSSTLNTKIKKYGLKANRRKPSGR